MTPEEDLKYLEFILNSGDHTKRQERRIKREIKYLHDKKSMHEAWNKLIDEIAKQLRIYELNKWLSKKFGGVMTPEERQAKVKWLSRYRILENQIKRLEAEAERWRSRASNTVPAPVHFKYYDSNKKSDQKILATMTRQELRRNNMMPVVVHGSGGLGIDDCIAEISDIQCQIQEKISQSIKVRAEIGKAIDAVPDDKLQLVLYYVYADGLRFEEISCEVGYSYRHVKRLHNEGLKLLNVVPLCPLNM